MKFYWLKPENPLLKIKALVFLKLKIVINEIYGLICLEDGIFLKGKPKDSIYVKSQYSFCCWGT